MWDYFLNLINYLILICKDTISFDILTFYPITLLTSIISFLSCFGFFFLIFGFLYKLLLYLQEDRVFFLSF